MLDGVFNLSMTFRRDSDVAFHYGGTKPAPSPSADALAAFEAQTRGWFQGKSRLAAWTVSHCYTASRREEYMAGLRPHAHVDVFGKCSGVRGGMGDEDYKALAPPGSYINTDWFATPAQLGDHLRAVASNYTLFRSYHTWRLTHELVAKDVYWHRNQVTERGAMCNLCTWLHAHQHALPSLQLNLTRFWDGSTQCRPPTDVAERRLLHLPAKLAGNTLALAWQG